MNPPFHAIKIAEHHPDIIIISGVDDKTCKFSAGVFRTEKNTGKLKECLYSFDHYIFDSADEAIIAMHKRVTKYLDAVLAMSN